MKFWICPRSRAAAIVLSEEEMNLAELVHGVVTMVQPQIHSKNLVFKTYISDLIHE